MMFCYQCQEAFKGRGCTERGSCGKDALTSNIMDLLIYTVKGVCMLSTLMRDNNIPVNNKVNSFVIESLYTTSSNCNYNRENLKRRISDGLKLKMELYNICRTKNLEIPTREEVLWANPANDFSAKAALITPIQTEPHEEQRAMKEFIIYTLKGIAGFMYNAMQLGKNDLGVHTFMQSVISDLTKKRISLDEWLDLVTICGQYTMRVMALLDKARTEHFGHPEFTSVNFSPKNRPAILVSGNNLKDLRELLEQSVGSGVDIYTHSSMIAAHAYPELRRFEHLRGNYGGSWTSQREEFPAFHGPILFTGGNIIPPTIELSYKERMFTTNITGYPGCKHIQANHNGQKDFSEIIAFAKEFRAPASLERGCTNIGFAHRSLSDMISQLLSAYGIGDIKRFVMILGEDGRSSARSYFSDLASLLPKSSILFTAGDVKYRFCKHRFGYLNGMPRLFDAGQIEDTYSLIHMVLELKKILHIQNINNLPINYFVSWYGQNSLAVLLALLSLGIKEIKLGPTMPPFCSERMTEALSKRFGLELCSTAERDSESIFTVSESALQYHSLQPF